MVILKKETWSPFLRFIKTQVSRKRPGGCRKILPLKCYFLAYTAIFLILSYTRSLLFLF